MIPVDMRLVAIEWLVGSFRDEGRPGTKLPPTIAWTTGFLYEDTDDYMTVITEVHGGEACLRTWTTVPRVCIRRVVELAPRYKPEAARDAVLAPA